mgnify:CR=1 FL=1
MVRQSRKIRSAHGSTRFTLARLRRDGKRLIARAQQEFIEACVHTLRPFQSDPGIEELFYRAFDGLEVLPLSLKQEYKDAMNQNPILAQELLVPIRYRQFYQLKKSGRVSFLGALPVVNLPYDPNVGLDMSSQDADSVDAD